VFIWRAEAFALGWTTENVATMYSKGLEMSWKQWGVFDQSKFNTFMSNAGVQLGTTNDDILTKVRTALCFFLP
jgi:hypothetical protein